MTFRKMILALSVGLILAGCASTQTSAGAGANDQTRKTFDRADRIGLRTK